MTIIDNNLLNEFRSKEVCEWCGRKCPAGLDPHHLLARGFGGGSRLDLAINLIGLCRGFTKEGWVSCHQSFHDGDITTDDLLAIVAARENMMQDEIKDKICELMRTPNDPGERRPRGKGMQ